MHNEEVHCGGISEEQLTFPEEDSHQRKSRYVSYTALPLLRFLWRSDRRAATADITPSAGVKWKYNALGEILKALGGILLGWTLREYKSVGRIARWRVAKV